MSLAVQNGKTKIINIFMQIGLHVGKKDFSHLAIYGNLELLKYYHKLNRKIYRIDNGLADIALAYGQYDVLEFLLHRGREPSTNTFMTFYRTGYDDFVDKGKKIFELLIKYKSIIPYLVNAHLHLTAITNKFNKHLLDIYIQSS
jgi:hypothetical protein